MAKRKSDNKSQPGRLRIVAGNWRSRLLEIADVPGLRPTSARIRETVFNWLAPRIAGARCLDLFAGTGALGLEALSRGAAACDFVEKSNKAVQTLEQNIATLGATSASVFAGSAEAFLQQPIDTRYEIVFLDPPFSANILTDVIHLLAASQLLAEDARIYVEQDRNQPDIEMPDGWQVLKSKESGNVRYSLLQVTNKATKTQVDN